MIASKGSVVLALGGTYLTRVVLDAVNMTRIRLGMCDFGTYYDTEAISLLLSESSNGRAIEEGKVDKVLQEGLTEIDINP